MTSIFKNFKISINWVDNWQSNYLYVQLNHTSLPIEFGMKFEAECLTNELIAESTLELCNSLSRIASLGYAYLEYPFLGQYDLDKKQWFYINDKGEKIYETADI